MKIIAHRGASIEHPENSIDSIIQALSHEVDAVEIDVHLSKDEIPVVIHDDSLERTHGDKRYVHDCFAKDLPVPTLMQVLELKRDCLLMIEIKEGRHDGRKLVEKVVEIARGHSKIVLASFCHDLLKGIEDFEVMGLSCEKNHIPPFEWICLDHNIIDIELMQGLQGKRVWTFTVDCPDKAIALSQMGVEGIITNDPRPHKVRRNSAS
mgnify:CR=1 FL=1